MNPVALPSLSLLALLHLLLLLHTAQATWSRELLEAAPGEINVFGELQDYFEAVTYPSFDTLDSAAKFQERPTVSELSLPRAPSVPLPRHDLPDSAAAYAEFMHWLFPVEPTDTARLHTYPEAAAAAKAAASIAIRPHSWPPHDASPPGGGHSCRVALGCVLGGPLESLVREVPSWLSYHRGVGVTWVYLGYDGSDRASLDFLRSLPGTSVLPLSRALATVEERSVMSGIMKTLHMDSANRTTGNQLLMDKQSLLLSWAILEARKDGMDWLAHIDVDELFYSYGPSGRVDALLSSVSDHVASVRWMNHEGQLEAADVQDKFRQVTLFRGHMQSLPPLALNFRNRMRLGDTKTFLLLYANGKSAVRVDAPGARPNGPHQFTGDPSPRWVPPGFSPDMIDRLDRTDRQGRGLGTGKRTRIRGGVGDTGQAGAIRQGLGNGGGRGGGGAAAQSGTVGTGVDSDRIALQGGGTGVTGGTGSDATAASDGSGAMSDGGITGQLPITGHPENVTFRGIEDGRRDPGMLRGLRQLSAAAAVGSAVGGGLKRGTFLFPFSIDIQRDGFLLHYPYSGLTDLVKKAVRTRCRPGVVERAIQLNSTAPLQQCILLDFDRKVKLSVEMAFSKDSSHGAADGSDAAARAARASRAAQAALDPEGATAELFRTHLVLSENSTIRCPGRPDHWCLLRDVGRLKTLALRAGIMQRIRSVSESMARLDAMFEVFLALRDSPREKAEKAQGKTTAGLAAGAAAASRLGNRKLATERPAAG